MLNFPFFDYNSFFSDIYIFFFAFFTFSHSLFVVFITYSFLLLFLKLLFDYKQTNKQQILQECATFAVRRIYK